ncbi:hypothetical protein J6590_085625 [Homalodisca vitripennis]|nr:hypothetical protein J6590_085625 [Homalodisca vitripennis]
MVIFLSCFIPCFILKRHECGGARTRYQIVKTKLGVSQREGSTEERISLLDMKIKPDNLLSTYKDKVFSYFMFRIQMSS